MSLFEGIKKLIEEEIAVMHSSGKREGEMPHETAEEEKENGDHRSNGYTIESGNMAVPEIHVAKARHMRNHPAPEKEKEAISYDSLAIPEVHTVSSNQRHKDHKDQKDHKDHNDQKRS